jgi:hypothetical protein
MPNISLYNFRYFFMLSWRFRYNLEMTFRGFNLLKTNLHKKNWKILIIKFKTSVKASVCQIFVAFLVLFVSFHKDHLIKNPKNSLLVTGNHLLSCELHLNFFSILEVLLIKLCSTWDVFSLCWQYSTGVLKKIHLHISCTGLQPNQLLVTHIL